MKWRLFLRPSFKICSHFAHVFQVSLLSNTVVLLTSGACLRSVFPSFTSSSSLAGILGDSDGRLGVARADKPFLSVHYRITE